MVSGVQLVLVGLFSCLVEGQYTTLMLTPSFNNTEERHSMCAGEIVVFTCEVTGTGILKWGIKPYVDVSQNLLRFRVYDDLIVGQTISGTDGLYNATLTSVSPDPGDRRYGNLTSELSVLVVLAKSIEVLCDDGIGTSRSIDVPPADSPSPPSNLTYDIKNYGITNYTVQIKWEAPIEHRGVEFRSYVITDAVLWMTSYTFEHSVTFTFLYNNEQEVIVSAKNCNGFSRNSSISIVQVSCGRPSPPANGTIEPYSSTQVGAEIQFHCDEGHTPREWRTSQCQENGMWTPDPALLNCTVVNCGSPTTAPNTNLTVTTTIYNSTTTYTCGNGLVPSEVYTTVCTEKGDWEPDPSTLECREPVTCDAPDLPKMVTFNGTTEGSRMIITCQEGMGGAEFVCNKHGLWYPDPAEYGCRDHDSQMDNYDATAIVLTNMATAAIVFSLGVVTGAVARDCWRKFQCKTQREQKVPPKDIELRDNPAYEHIKRRRQ